MNLIFLIVLTLSLISCEQENEIEINDSRVIDIESNVGKSRTVFLSEIAESIEYIPLETTVESLIGIPRMKSLIYENNLLFVFQKGDYFKIFDSKGNYIRTFNNHGNGPKEYVTLNNAITNNNAEVISIASAKNIVEFKTNGEYIRAVDYPDEESLRDVVYDDFDKIGNNYYVRSISIINPNIISDYSAIVFDSSSRVVLKIPYSKKARKFASKIARKKFNYIPLAGPISPSSFNFKDNIRIINGTDEYVLNINENLQIDTVYRLNYGKYNVVNFPDLYNVSTKEKPFIQLIRNVFESSSFLFMSFRTGNLPIKNRKITNLRGRIMTAPITCSYFDKNTGKFTFIDPCGVDEFGFIDDFEGGPAFWPLYISQDDYMVSHLDAFTFIEYAKNHKVSEKFKKIADGLKETDNLVVVRVKLK